MADSIDPSHDRKRSLLRFVGPLILAIGLVFTAIGTVCFFVAFGSHEPPRLFWCNFVGLPLIWLGGTLSSAGFMGAVQRYLAGESAPVAKDTLNYLAEETKPGIKTIATAISEGLSAGQSAAPAAAHLSITCPKCRQSNSAGARFCKACGAAIAETKSCPACKKMNGADAAFCDHCGTKLTS